MANRRQGWPAVKAMALSLQPLWWDPAAAWPAPATSTIRRSPCLRAKGPASWKAGWVIEAQLPFESTAMVVLTPPGVNQGFWTEVISLASTSRLAPWAGRGAIATLDTSLRPGSAASKA